MRFAGLATGVLCAGLLAPLRVLADAADPAGGEAAVCAAPAALIADDTPLPHLHAAVVKGGVVGVLAIGSGSMLGQMPGGPETSFPYRMRDALQAAWPGTQIQLSVSGGRGVTAAEMLTSMRQELAHAHYAVVLWQTGTVEAVHGASADEFYRTLSSGAAAAHEAGADLVLIDTPYNRALRRRADVAPYEGALVRAARLGSVAIFHRHDLMRFWVDAGRLDLERTPRAELGPTITALHDCLGKALAQMLERGAVLATN